MARLLVLHGPNLNLLGTREPELYGTLDLASIDKHLTEIAKELGHTLDHMQSNAEHELIDAIQKAKEVGVDFIIINPAAYTHTSVAIRDALLAVQIPFIEIHLSNLFARELFRYNSYVSDIAIGVITGLGVQGYELALQAAHNYLSSATESKE